MSAGTRDFTTQKAWCPSRPGHRWGQRVAGEAKLQKPEDSGIRPPPPPNIPRHCYLNLFLPEHRIGTEPREWRGWERSNTRFPWGAKHMPDPFGIQSFIYFVFNLPKSH